MLFGETVAVYCKNHTEHIDTVRTSQETRYVTATKPNWLMLLGEMVSVYCENSTVRTGTVRTSQETRYFTATKPNWLMLFGETVSVYCENHTEHTDKLCGQNVEFWTVNAGGTYSRHRALEGSTRPGSQIGSVK
jgi:translation initiation factor IF-1